MNLTHSWIPLNLPWESMNEEHLAKVNLTQKSKEKIQPSKWREQACFTSWRRSATPTACAISAEMALGLRQTSHGSGVVLPPPFLFFVAVGANFFQRPRGIHIQTKSTFICGINVVGGGGGERTNLQEARGRKEKTVRVRRAGEGDWEGKLHATDFFGQWRSWFFSDSLPEATEWVGQRKTRHALQPNNWMAAVQAFICPAQVSMEKHGHQEEPPVAIATSRATVTV